MDGLTTPPIWIQDVASGGYSYVKWRIFAIRSFGAQVQAAEFALRLAGSTVAWPVGTTASGDYDSGLPPSNLIDGSTSKWFENGSITDSSEGTYVELIFNMGEAVAFDSYRYQTGNDSNQRDPVGWYLYGSNNGTDWVELDYITSATITTSRNAWTQDFSV